MKKFKIMRKNDKTDKLETLKESTSRNKKEAKLEFSDYIISRAQSDLSIMYKNVTLSDLGGEVPSWYEGDGLYDKDNLLIIKSGHSSLKNISLGDWSYYIDFIEINRISRKRYWIILATCIFLTIAMSSLTELRFSTLDNFGTGYANMGESILFEVLEVLFAPWLYPSTQIMSIAGLSAVGSSGNVTFDILGLLDLVLFIYLGTITNMRLHDVNKSGWLMLIPFYNTFLLIQKGTKGLNKYGDPPAK